MKPQTLILSNSLSILLLLSANIALAGEQAADSQAMAEAPTPAYSYSDDWAVVSAPPPQGPYNAINLDPRLPGQDLVAPMPMPDPGTPDIQAPVGAVTPSRAAADAARQADSPRPASLPPQTPYDYQPQPVQQEPAVRATQAPAQPLTAPVQADRGYAQIPASQDRGPLGFMNQPFPDAGRPPVAPAQQMMQGQRPVPGYYRSQDYSQPAARPMYGYPWPSRQPYSGYPAAAYPQPLWQGGDLRTSEEEVPPPSVYNRMMAEPPRTRYAPPPGRVEYYGGGR